MDFKMTLTSVLCVLCIYLKFAEGWTDLHYGETEIEGYEGVTIKIVCESEISRDGAGDDEVRRKIRWLRGGPPVEDLEVVASSDGRMSIDAEILSETTTGDMVMNSTLTIYGAVVKDSTNYTCCIRDAPMCNTWRQRKQRQLELIILPAKTVTELRITSTMTTPLQEWITYNPLEPSTISTTFTNEIQERSVIPGVNETFHQKPRYIYFMIVFPGVLAVVLVSVVVFIIRYYVRRRKMFTIAQDFNA